MIGLFDLWMPILVAAVLIFIASSVIHMASPMHKSDYSQLPGEDAILDLMRTHNVGRGQYMFPWCGSMSGLDTPEMKEKFARGPVGYAILGPSGPFNIGKSLITWFLYTLLVGIFVAYIATLNLERGAEYLTVFQTTGAAAVLAYAFSSFPDSIWKMLPWRITFKFLIDGVIYGLLTAGSFAWLWPDAA